jgi:hypothetical protein
MTPHNQARQLDPGGAVSPKRLPLATAVILAAVAFGCSAEAEEKFKQLSGAQIRAKIAGMVLTDEVHWRDVYEPSGVVKSHSMGVQKTGKWSIEENELCVEIGKEPPDCHEVWLSGVKVELRRPGLNFPVEGVLKQITDGK